MTQKAAILVCLWALWSQSGSFQCTDKSDGMSFCQPAGIHIHNGYGYTYEAAFDTQQQCNDMIQARQDRDRAISNQRRATPRYSAKDAMGDTILVYDDAVWNYWCLPVGIHPREIR